MDITGKIIAVLPLRSGVSQSTGNPWASQEYVIEVPGQYPKKCVFRVFGEERIKSFAIEAGQDVTVSFDIDAHEYNGRWYNEVSCYNLVHRTPKDGEQQPQQPPQQTTNPDGLPF